MNDPNANRPGYKETKVGWIPEEWKTAPLATLKPGKPIVYGIVQAGAPRLLGNSLQYRCRSSDDFFYEPPTNRAVI